MSIQGTNVEFQVPKSAMVSVAVNPETDMIVVSVLVKSRHAHALAVKLRSLADDIEQGRAETIEG